MSDTGHGIPFPDLSLTASRFTSDHMGSFREQVERCILLSYEKREKLRLLAGEHFLDLDLDAGTARFSEKLMIPFQVLGTESDNTLTWLWAWADEQTDIPEQLTRSSREMRSWLEQEGLSDLVRPSVDLDLADGAMFSVVAADVCKASAFYRDPYEGGTLFLLLFDSAIDRQPDLDRAAFVRVLGEIIAQFDLDLRTVVRSYFMTKGLPYAESGDTANAQLSTGERVLLEFGGRTSNVRINGEPLE